MASDERVSREELARFLRNLAVLYKDRKLGNAKLSEALYELSRELRKGKSQLQPEFRLKPQSSISPGRKSPIDAEKLRDLDARAVERFLNDRSRTKSDFITLGWARFSIPKNRLLKLNTDAVIHAIRAALSNETSLAIISQEAKRGGAQRSS